MKALQPSMQPVNLSPQQLKPSAHLFDPNPFSTQPGLISEDQDPNPNWSPAATQESPLSPLKKQKIENGAPFSPLPGPSSDQQLKLFEFLTPFSLYIPPGRVSREGKD